MYYVTAVVERRRGRLAGLGQRLATTDLVDDQQIIEYVLLVYAVRELQWTHAVKVNHV